ncbi:MAG: RHS repeat-associated core domain-containing protein, partial [Pirellulaceae bacterium]|nr:RHS repeat-associated core domain-containing protein [Pirellulaceae bacterium]
TVTLAQNFNAAGNRTELKATIGSTLDFRNTYQFDTLGRVTEMIQQSQVGGNAVTAKRAAFAYNKLNQRTSVTRYQSTGTSNFVATTDYTYDTVNRLSGLTHKQSSTTLAGYTYGYDGLSRLTGVTSTIEGLSTYTYDATSQVVGADHAAGGQADETYGFDLNGNRNTSGYTTSTNNHTTADPGFTYTYDDQGNRTSRTETSTGKVTEYSWDHRNRLVTVKDRNTAGGSVVKQVDYAYDAFNRLVKRTFDADGAGAGAATNQYWVYDEGINAVLQLDGPAASNLSHRYLWSDRVDELMADETVGSGADTLYALRDHLGTIRDIANFNESTSVTSVTNHRTYNSFGKLVSETNAAVDLIFGYTGKQLDEATSLQHNLFRWYDSSLGQWLSEDPMGFAAGDENLRRYVGNKTIGSTDSSGLVEDPPTPLPSQETEARMQELQRMINENQALLAKLGQIKAAQERVERESHDLIRKWGKDMEDRWRKQYQSNNPTPTPAPPITAPPLLAPPTIRNPLGNYPTSPITNSTMPPPPNYSYPPPPVWQTIPNGGQRIYQGPGNTWTTQPPPIPTTNPWKYKK